MKQRVLLILTAFIGLFVQSQRVYKATSVLAAGNWYKIAVERAGIYKIDIPFISELGINAANLSSGSIRLFSNGGDMLSENNNISLPDDLAENVILVVNGGSAERDGLYFIFFKRSRPMDKRFNQQKIHP